MRFSKILITNSKLALILPLLFVCVLSTSGCGGMWKSYRDWSYRMGEMMPVYGGKKDKQQQQQSQPQRRQPTSQPYPEPQQQPQWQAPQQGQMQQQQYQQPPMGGQPYPGGQMQPSLRQMPVAPAPNMMHDPATDIVPPPPPPGVKTMAPPAVPSKQRAMPWRNNMPPSNPQGGMPTPPQGQDMADRRSPPPPPPGFPPQGMPQGTPPMPEGYAPGMPQQGMPPQGMPPQGMPPMPQGGAGAPPPGARGPWDDQGEFQPIPGVPDPRYVDEYDPKKAHTYGKKKFKYEEGEMYPYEAEAPWVDEMKEEVPETPLDKIAPSVNW